MNVSTFDVLRHNLTSLLVRKTGWVPGHVAKLAVRAAQEDRVVAIERDYDVEIRIYPGPAEPADTNMQVFAIRKDLWEFVDGPIHRVEP